MTAPATEWRPAAPGPAPSAAPHRRAAGRKPADRAWLWSTPPVLILAAIFLYPLVLVFKQAFQGAKGTGFTEDVTFSGTVTSDSARTTMWNSVQMAAYSTIGCLILGFVLALIVAFVPFPGAKGVSKFIDVFLSFPSFLITVSIMFVYGRVGMVNGLLSDVSGSHREPLNFIYTPWGIWLGELIYFTPFVMRPLLSAFSQLDTGQLEVAASLGARPLKIVRQVILPESLPALFAGGSLVLLLTMNEYGIVSFTGSKYTTLPVVIANFATEQGNYAGACALAVVNIAMSLVLFAIYRVLLARMSGGRRAAVVA
jgi:2-aminoethylphosphonate transport system permease protein